MWNLRIFRDDPKPYGCGGYYSMYPNPASDEITVTINEAESLVTNESDISDITFAKVISTDKTTYTIRIYNNLGTLLLTATRSGTSFKIPLTNMRDGTYIVEVSNGKNSYREQLIIKHD
jgi:exosome complex RNA-binding protein Csl4